MASPLCNLYFFSDPEADSSSPDMYRIAAKAKKAICDCKSVKGFHFIKDTAYASVPEALNKIKTFNSKRAFYPNSVIVRDDGVVLGLYLANGRSTITPANIKRAT